MRPAPYQSELCWVIVGRVLRAHRLVGFQADSWVRTARVAGEDSGPPKG